MSLVPQSDVNPGWRESFNDRSLLTAEPWGTVQEGKQIGSDGLYVSKSEVMASIKQISIDGL